MEQQRDPGQWQEITPETLEKLVFLVKNEVDIITSCFILSISFREAIPLLKDKVSARFYVRAIKPLLKMARAAGVPIREVCRIYSVSFRTASRAGLSEEQLKNLQATERRRAKERKKKKPELIEYQRAATARWRETNYEREKERQKERRRKDPEFKEKARLATEKWRKKTKA